MIVEVSEPDGEHVVIENPYCPGVAKARRRTGFPVHRTIVDHRAAHKSLRRTRVVRQHIKHNECRFTRKHTCRRSSGVNTEPIHQWPQLAVVSQRCVQRHQLAHRELSSAQVDCESVSIGAR